MNINNINLNDLAQKILHEDLHKSLDILDEHIEVLKNIDCDGVPFLAAVFCKAIDEGAFEICERYVPQLFSAKFHDRAIVEKYAVQKNMSFEHIQILLEHDFACKSETEEKPIDCMRVLIDVAMECVKQQRWDVLQWIVSCLEGDDLEYIYLCCHYYNPYTFRHVDIPLDAISVVCTALNPLTRVDFHWSRATSKILVEYGLQTIDNALRACTLDPNLRILYTLCTHVYHQNTKHLTSYLQQTDVIHAVQNPSNRNDVYNLIDLALFHNSPYAAQVLLEMVRATETPHNFLPQLIVHNMVWQNLPTWISSEHVSKETATWNLPFAVAYNQKEIGFLLLDIGVDFSEPIDWIKIEEIATEFNGLLFERGEDGVRVRQQRLDNWVREYEKSVLEIELQSIAAHDTQRKI